MNGAARLDQTVVNVIQVLVVAVRLRQRVHLYTTYDSETDYR